MKEYYINAQYTISVRMVIEAESYEEAMDIANDCEYCIDTEWTGNSVFVREGDLPDGVNEMTVYADGTLRDFECEEEE